MCVEVMELPNSSGEENRFTSSASVGPSNSNSHSYIIARQLPKGQLGALTTLAASSATSYIQHQPPSPSVPKKILSKNINGTVVVTSTPTNDAELQLYRVMQRASLLAYYDTLLEMGGDDVQQLCDAGEEEFLEIMALVGMASKPLHVRRLQKSLQEWVTNPSLFQVPLVPGNAVNEPVGFSNSKSNVAQVVYCSDGSTLENNRQVYSSSPGVYESVCALPSVTSPGLSLSKSSRPYSPFDTPSCPSSSSSSPGSGTSTLLDSQISRLAAAAERISKHLSQLEPKTHNSKKKVCKELESVMAMSENDPRRMEELRKYAAIYGRFDCKRKPEKPLSLHELSVNEAAAQICRFVPALLTRRDELFPLARQVVRDSGYLFSKGAVHTLQPFNRNSSESFNNDGVSGNVSHLRTPDSDDSDISVENKRLKLESGADVEDPRQESFTNDDIVTLQPTMNTLLHQQANHHVRDHFPRSLLRAADCDDMDSRVSSSNSRSPPSQRTSDVAAELNNEVKDSSNIQVIAASGDNIIAVANPALVLSTTIMPTKQVRDTRNITG